MKGTLSVRLLVFASLALAGCAERRQSPPSGAVTAAIAWSASTPVTSSTGGGAAPAFAASPSGGLTLAWVAAPDAGSQGRLMVRPDAGSPVAHQLVDPSGSLAIYGETPPKIAYAPDGTLYAAYLVTRAVAGRRWPINALRFATSADGGAHWEVPRTVSSDADFGGSTNDHALHVAADGAIYLSWLAQERDSSHTYVTHSTDRGETWSAPVRIDAGASCPCCRTAIASGADGSLYAAWRKIFPGNAGQTETRDIVVAAIPKGERRWGPGVRVHADDWHVTYCPDAGPSIRVGEDGVVHVAWWTGREGRAGVQYTASRDGGRTFEAPVPLGLAPLSRAAHVQLAVGRGVNSGLVVAAWDDGTRKVSPVVARLSRDGGRTFGDTQLLSADGQSAGYPVVDLRADTVTVAWQERTMQGAAHDSGARSAAHGHGSTPWIDPVGSWQVVSRRGVVALAGATVGQAGGGAFTPLAVGAPVPRYAARIIEGRGAARGGADSARVGPGEPFTLLNVWATWCTSCREEMADLAALQHEYGGRGLEVVAVRVDQGSSDRVERYAATEHLAFTVAHDASGTLQQRFQVVGVPASYLVGRDGRLLWSHTGNLHDVLPAARRAIESSGMAGGGAR
ncbi:MAG: hypothetical protein NVS9B3_08910 [Gemmatimonadaceae bacterium]